LKKPEFAEFALDWTGEAVKYHGQNPGLVEQRAETLLLAGQVEAACPFWQQVRSVSSPSVAIGLLICEIALGRTPTALPSAVREKADVEFLKVYRRLLQWNVSSVVNALNSQVDLLREFVPNTASMLEAAVAEAAQV